MKAVQAALVLLAVLASPVSTAAAADKLRVAVLPFKNVTGLKADDPFSQGFSETLTDALLSIPSLILVERSQLDRVIREQKLSLSDLFDASKATSIGKLLNVEQLVIGSFQRDADNLMVIARFVHVETGRIDARHRVRVVGMRSKVFGLQEEMVRRILDTFGVKTTVEQKRRIRRSVKQTASVDAYQLYLRGRKAYYRISIAGFQEAVGWFQRAIQVDPNYAQAHSGMAQAYAGMAFQRKQNGQPYFADAEASFQAARRAIALSPTLAEGHRALAQANIAVNRSAEAVPLLREALRLNPNDAEAWYLLWLAQGRRLDDTAIRKSLELNPRSSVAHNGLALAYIVAGNLFQAEAHARSALEIDPQNAIARSNLGAVYERQGRFAEAGAAYERAAQDNPDYALARINLSALMARAGQFMPALQLLNDVVARNPDNAAAHYNLALLYRNMGDFARAQFHHNRFQQIQAQQRSGLRGFVGQGQGQGRGLFPPR